MRDRTGTEAARLPLLARTLRGIEEIAAAEIRARLAPTSLSIGHREVRFESSDLSNAVELGVADDVFLVLLDDEPISHVKAGLATLAARGRSVDLASAVGTISGLRPISATAFDVSASFLGERNYSRFDIEDAVGAELGSSTGWSYESRRNGPPAHTELSVRVHLTGDRTTIGLRLAATPLHRRAYRVASRPGALHPPLARALVHLSEPSSDAVLLDPFCGTGTIPIEAKRWCPTLSAMGSDLEPMAIAAARANAAAARVAVGLEVADAASLTDAPASVDQVATNPPWGASVDARGALVSTLRPFWRAVDRALTDDGRIAMLLPKGYEIPTGSAFEVAQRQDVRVSGAVVELLVIRRRSAGRTS
jgi:tRNA (guanine6-N2)-methyltransferase